MKALSALTLALLTAGHAAVAQDVPVETSTLGKQSISVSIHPFLSAEELTVLRLVAVNDDALKLFVTRPGRFSAIAVAPAEGLIRDGKPIDSAKAISDLPSARRARQAALTECNSAKTKGPDCVIVLEVAPAR